LIASGDMFAQRFEILAQAGSGGMGTIFRALDFHSGQLVALKLMSTHSTQHSDIERFNREARMLAELRHPGIVAYVAHGQSSEGYLYLAMEWLEGEDLSQRLSRAPLSIPDTLLMLRGASDALSLLHHRGIIHRDLKPSNLFLRDGNVERVALLDFGIARRRQASHIMTRTGSLVGTPEYMAPEQARGERSLTPATDVFALGCVVYECLTGRPPFVADQVAARLAKILFEEPIPIRRLLPNLPEPLEGLLHRMLAKDAAQRPRDAGGVHAGVVGMLGRAGAAAAAGGAAGEPEPHRLTVHEQELVSVVLATEKGRAPAEEASPLYSYRVQLAEELLRFGMQAEWLGDGSLVATLLRAGNATDQVAKAARAALELRERWPEAEVALSTGRGVVQGRLPVGEVIDRAAHLLSSDGGPVGDAAAAGEVILDEVSAALLDARFVLLPTSTLARWRLCGERPNTDSTRTLLGKPTQCVGREPELGMLEALLSGCRDDGAACAVLIKASPGLGKSRLWHELLRRLRARGEDVEIFCGRSDAMSSGSPYGIAANMVQGLCQLVGGEPLEDQRRKLRQRIGRHLDPAEQPRVVEFLGELCGVPFPDGESPALRAARSEPKGMSRAIQQAFLDFLRAECGQRPVLIGIDDLQWGDGPSVALIGAALRELADHPLLVVALGRPEVSTTFPQLWADKVQEISLSGLSRKAGERLILEVLGQKVEPKTMSRIVSQAAGNALYLEELIRAEAMGRGQKMPETILAMLQSRLSYLEPGARRLLRAASIFGETFWRDGVRALLHGHGHGQRPLSPADISGPTLRGDPPSRDAPSRDSLRPDSQPDGELDGWLSILADAELVERHRDSRLPGDVEYRFRHGLLREAAYSLLTPADQRLGHRLAADFLEAAEPKREPGHPPWRPLLVDPLMLAEHAQRGGQSVRATSFYLRAAEQALASNDLSGAHEHAARGIESIRLLEEPAQAHAESVELLGSLRALQALSHFWRGEWGPANAAGREAMRLLPRGNFRWTHPMRASFLMLFGRPRRAYAPKSSPAISPAVSLLPTARTIPHATPRPSPPSQKN
jgi:hypothetical protein